MVNNIRGLGFGQGNHKGGNRAGFLVHGHDAVVTGIGHVKLPVQDQHIARLRQCARHGLDGGKASRLRIVNAQSVVVGISDDDASRAGESPCACCMRAFG